VRASFGRRRFLAVSAGAAVAGLFAADRAPVRAQGLTSINVGMSFRNLDAVAAWIAQDKRFFEKYGLNVTIINIQGGAKTVASMAVSYTHLTLPTICSV